MSPKDALKICKDEQRRISNLEKIILDSNDSTIVFDYVCFVVKDRFQEGEEILANDTYWAVAYAVHFLKAPFEGAHSKIFESSQYNQIMVNKYKGFLDDIGYDYSEWKI